MQQTTKPVSKFKVVLLWSVLLGNLVFWIAFIAWLHRNDPAPLNTEGTGSAIVTSILLFFIGGFFLAAGVAGYFLTVVTTCFTFNFTLPVFAAYKGKLYLAKIFIPMCAAVGIGLFLSIGLAPLMRSFGIHGQFALLVPLFIALVPLQIAQMWVNIWVPITKKLIAKRLAARGIVPAQMQAAILCGISDPTRSSFKKLTLIEDDIGALWIGADQLVYWGDIDGFALRREEIIQLERRADAGNTSMLAGTAHVILHVQQPTCAVRQIRLHTEGYWTLGQNRQAMDTLAAAITSWHSAAQPLAQSAN